MTTERENQSLHPAQERYTIWQDIGPQATLALWAHDPWDDHQRPPKEASAHPVLRSSCDLVFWASMWKWPVSFLPAHTLDTITAVEMKSLDFYGNVYWP